MDKDTQILTLKQKVSELSDRLAESKGQLAAAQVIQADRGVGEQFFKEQVGVLEGRLKQKVLT